MGSTKLTDLGVSARQGSREYQEDRFLVAEPGSLLVEELALYAIFDGHGGPVVSNHARTHFTHQFNHQLKRSRGKAYDEVLKAALRRENDAIRHLHVDKQGSTAAIALLNLKHGLLVSANLGDSHVMLAEQKASHDPRSSRWRVKRLSKAHRPTTRDERRRIAHAGGKIVDYADGARIGPVNVSRALGDHELKQPLAGKIHATHIAANGQITGDLVSGEAHTSTHHLQVGRSLVLICSDGIGDEEQAQEVAALAAESWQRGRSAQDIASSTTDHAAKHRGSDNCTAIVVCLDCRPG